MRIDFAAKLSYQRPSRSAGEAPLLHDAYDISRQFESDRGRIINSAAIRRLQQKTQVFPLERNAAVRSRLTHSMEVQQVGRHIAREILHCLAREGRIDALGLTHYTDAFESCVEMACLMHDMGNPPFGHFGEAAIKSWFGRELGVSADGHNQLDDEACQVPFLRPDGRDAALDRLRAQLRIDLSNFGERPIHSPDPYPAETESDLWSDGLCVEVHPPGLLAGAAAAGLRLPDEETRLLLGGGAFRHAATRAGGDALVPAFSADLHHGGGG